MWSDVMWWDERGGFHESAPGVTPNFPWRVLAVFDWLIGCGESHAQQGKANGMEWRKLAMDGRGLNSFLGCWYSPGNNLWGQGRKKLPNLWKPTFSHCCCACENFQPFPKAGGSYIDCSFAYAHARQNQLPCVYFWTQPLKQALLWS